MTAKLAVGAKAPDFTLPRDGGGEVSLKDFRGQKLVLYFYPKADTSGCTREAIDFTKHTQAFKRAGAAVLGVSADPVKALDRFRIETPSWGYANTGTRFGKFVQPAAATTRPFGLVNSTDQLVPAITTLGIYCQR